ncbi:MAG: reverse transcriptase domain-containing protein [Clostridia bacterium]
MRNPNDVLNSLKEKATITNYNYERLYRNLYNPKFYLIAYQNIYVNKGSMTSGIDNITIDGMGMERIDLLIEQMKSHSYTPNPVKRIYIPKKNGKTRPLGIPSVDDKLVQEVVRMILESIYEPNFSSKSHGFRPYKSCHTALTQIQKSFTGIKWFVEGDIKGCFDNIDQHILINILRKRIKDEYFISLIWKFLRAGYLENRTLNNTYSGSAQGSVISPILANIYMNEFDLFIEKYKEKFDKGNSRANNPEYNRSKSKWYGYKQTTEKNKDKYSKEELAMRNAEIQKRFNAWSNLPSMEQMDKNYRRIQYTRYADDFLIGIIGSKEDTEKVRKDIKEFLLNDLKLELSVEKTLITHSEEKARFLGYDVTTSKKSKHFIRKNNGKYRMSEGIIKLYIPKEIWRNKLLDNENMIIKKDKNVKEIWKPVARSNFVNRTPVEIIGGFNAEIRGLYNYYSLASNVSVLNKYYYIMQYSMYNTFACKFRCSKNKIIKKYKQNKIFSVEYETTKGEVKKVEFYHDGFKMKPINKNPKIDILPKSVTIYNFKPKELIVRMLESKCELCGKEKCVVKTHHVKALKELKPHKTWENIMISKRRKTLVVCDDCYNKIKADI